MRLQTAKAVPGVSTRRRENSDLPVLERTGHAVWQRDIRLVAPVLDPRVASKDQDTAPVAEGHHHAQFNSRTNDAIHIQRSALAAGSSCHEKTIYGLSAASDASIFLPCCMECRRGLAMILSVRLSVCQSNAWFVTKRKKDCVQIFIPHERSLSLVVLEKKTVGGGDPLYLKFLVDGPPLECKSPIFSR